MPHPKLQLGIRVQRQARLGTIEGLDLLFLVDAQHQGFVRVIEIQSNDIGELLDKVFVMAEIEGLYEMKLEGVLLPNMLNRQPTDFLGLTILRPLQWVAL